MTYWGEAVDDSYSVFGRGSYFPIDFSITFNQ